MGGCGIELFGFVNIIWSVFKDEMLINGYVKMILKDYKNLFVEFFYVSDGKVVDSFSISREF